MFSDGYRLLGVLLDNVFLVCVRVCACRFSLSKVIMNGYLLLAINLLLKFPFDSMT